MRPDADAIAGHQAQAQQRAGQSLGFALQFAVAVAQALVDADQRLMLRLARRDGVKKFAYGLLDQRCIGGAARLAVRQERDGPGR